MMNILALDQEQLALNPGLPRLTIFFTSDYMCHFLDFFFFFSNTGPTNHASHALGVTFS